MTGNAIAGTREIFTAARGWCGRGFRRLRVRKRYIAEHKKRGGDNFHSVHVIRSMVFVISPLPLCRRVMRCGEPEAMEEHGFRPVISS
jgi:hypothetical protein